MARDTLNPAVQLGDRFAGGSDIGVFRTLCFGGQVGVHQGELYALWSEAWADTSNYQQAAGYSGPYVARFRSGSWELVGGPLEPGFGPYDTSNGPPSSWTANQGAGGPFARYCGGSQGGGPRDGAIASDGSNLYVAYKVIYHVDIGGSVMSEVRVRVWKFDGVGWTDLGTLGGGLSSFGDYGENGRLWLSATTDEPGACYVAYAQSGFVGDAFFSATGYNFWLAGYGSSSLGVVDLAPSAPAPSWGPAFAYVPAYALAGAGPTLALYWSYDELNGIGGTPEGLIRVQGAGGALPSIPVADLTLADSAGDTISWAAPRAVSSEVVAGWRDLLCVTNQENRTLAVSETPGSWEATDPDAGNIVAAAFADAPVSISAETGNLWAGTSRSETMTIRQLDRGCSPHQWYDLGIHQTGLSLQPLILFEDGLCYFERLDVLGSNLQTVSNLAGVKKIPICRGCQPCATVAAQGLHVWDRF